MINVYGKRIPEHTPIQTDKKGSIMFDSPADESQQKQLTDGLTDVKRTKEFHIAAKWGRGIRGSGRSTKGCAHKGISFALYGPPNVLHSRRKLI